jgi:predicted RNase H-like HicB family nuclease
MRVMPSDRRVAMSRNFTVAIQKEENWFVAKCLENSVASQGKTIDEAIVSLKEALVLYYEDEILPVLPQTFVTTLEVAL